ncbi:MAG: phenylacetate-CoA oxygenase subunit PaaC [Actinomycetia bacterium]|nr:phenylacetate-CoA oxygenase subunit PaaC [Actinomycetes bacterium]
MNTITTQSPLATYIVRHADDNVIIGQRLAEYISRAPELEEDLAVANFALDHIGVANHLYTYAASVDGGQSDADALAMMRSEREFTNLLLVEQPHSDFGELMARQFLFDAYQVGLWGALSESSDETISGISQRAVKEAAYHLRHSSGWVIRLGDGTQESHDRMQSGIDRMWRYTEELFFSDELDQEMARAAIGVDPAILRTDWERVVDDVLEEATLTRPSDPYQTGGGRSGGHTEHLGKLLAEMQWMQRSYPGMTW